MGTFNVKNFFGSMFTPVEDEMEENYYGEEEGYKTITVRKRATLKKMHTSKSLLQRNLMLRNSLAPSFRSPQLQHL